MSVHPPTLMRRIYVLLLVVDSCMFPRGVAGQRSLARPYGGTPRPFEARMEHELYWCFLHLQEEGIVVLAAE